MKIQPRLVAALSARPLTFAQLRAKLPDLTPVQIRNGLANMRYHSRVTFNPSTKRWSLMGPALLEKPSRKPSVEDVREALNEVLTLVERILETK